jgi:hypothetical protein
MYVRATISASGKFAVRHIPGTVSSVKYGGPSVRVALGPHARYDTIRYDTARHDILTRRLALCQVGGGDRTDITAERSASHAVRLLLDGRVVSNGK